LTNESPFRPIQPDDETRVGPRGILICGYAPDAAAPLQTLLAQINAPEAPLVFCTEAMLAQSLEEALTEPAAGSPAPPDKLPPVMVLSGLTGRELHTFLEQFDAANLPRPIFAAATTINLTFTVRQLLIALLQENRARQET
jgi:hypothetical protein